MATGQQHAIMISHLAYEVAALECTMRHADDRFYFEAFLVHTRALRDFFWRRGRGRNRDTVAQDFVEDIEEWRSQRGPRSSLLMKTWDPIDRQLAHLTWDRADRSKFLNLQRYVQPLGSELLRQWDILLANVSAPRAAQFRAALGKRRAQIGCGPTPAVRAKRG
jgi:hypothetical protein